MLITTLGKAEDDILIIVSRIYHQLTEIKLISWISLTCLH